MNMMKLSESLAVSGQIQPEDIVDIADAGYKVLVNNRPDGEQPGQPTAAEMAKAAEAAGLEYHYMPVEHANFPGADFESFGLLIDNIERPVFAYCRSGTRCANLWVVSRPEADVEDAAALVQRSGFDLGFAAQYFSSRKSS
jgi:uncharacterized protein (TIGR01244 family)